MRMSVPVSGRWRRDVGRHHLSVVTVEGEHQGDNLGARAGEQEDVGAPALIRAGCRIRPRRGRRWRRWTRIKPCTCMTCRIRFRLQPVRKVQFIIVQTADGLTPRGYRHRPNLLPGIKESKLPPTGPGSPVIGFRFGCCSTSSPTTSGQSLASAGLAPCPELVADEPPAGPLQDWRPPHPTSRYFILQLVESQLVESHLTSTLLRQILGRIERLP